MSTQLPRYEEVAQHRRITDEVLYVKQERFQSPEKLLTDMVLLKAYHQAFFADYNQPLGNQS